VLLRRLSLLFFYGYVLAVVAAGAWGMFGARLDFPILMHQQVGHLDPNGARNVLSQYRFLRGLELGFGILALRFRREIYTQRTLNRLFLTIMALGIAGRVAGLAIDGVPSPVMVGFLVFEAVGIVLIVADTRSVTTS
jgi:hypothetical protein